MPASPAPVSFDDLFGPPKPSGGAVSLDDLFGPPAAPRRAATPAQPERDWLDDLLGGASSALEGPASFARGVAGGVGMLRRPIDALSRAAAGVEGDDTAGTLLADALVPERPQDAGSESPAITSLPFGIGETVRRLEAARMQRQPGAEHAAQFARSGVRVAGDLATDPTAAVLGEMRAAGTGGAALERVISAAFAGEMGPAALASAGRLKDEVSANGWTPRATGMAADLAAEAGLTAAAARGAIAPEPPAPPTLQQRTRLSERVARQQEIADLQASLGRPPRSDLKVAAPGDERYVDRPVSEQTIPAIEGAEPISFDTLFGEHEQPDLGVTQSAPEAGTVPVRAAEPTPAGDVFQGDSEAAMAAAGVEPAARLGEGAALARAIEEAANHEPGQPRLTGEPSPDEPEVFLSRDAQAAAEGRPLPGRFRARERPFALPPDQPLEHFVGDSDQAAAAAGVVPQDQLGEGEGFARAIEQATDQPPGAPRLAPQPVRLSPDARNAARGLPPQPRRAPREVVREAEAAAQDKGRARAETPAAPTYHENPTIDAEVRASMPVIAAALERGRGTPGGLIRTGNGPGDYVRYGPTDTGVKSALGLDGMAEDRHAIAAAIRRDKGNPIEMEVASHVAAKVEEQLDSGTPSNMVDGLAIPMRREAAVAPEPSDAVDTAPADADASFNPEQLEGAGRPARYEETPQGQQGRLEGTTRPESAPTIRTEGREARGPLFTQESDSAVREEGKKQTSMFGDDEGKASPPDPRDFPGGAFKIRPEITTDMVQRAFPNAKVRLAKVWREGGWQSGQSTAPEWIVDTPGRDSIMVRVEPNGISVANIQYGHPSARGGEEAAGLWRHIGTGGVIQLAKMSADEGVLRHEAFHGAMSVALKPGERMAVLRHFMEAARKDYEASGAERPWNTLDDPRRMRMAEERAADAYSKWQPAAEPNGIFERIRSFFGRIYNTFRPSWQSAFGEVHSGRAFERKPGPGAQAAGPPAPTVRVGGGRGTATPDLGKSEPLDLGAAQPATAGKPAPPSVTTEQLVARGKAKGSGRGWVRSFFDAARPSLNVIGDLKGANDKPIGKELKSRFERFFFEWERPVSREVGAYEEAVNRLTDEQWKGAVDVLEGRGTTDPKARAAAKAIRGILDGIAKDADATGTFVGYRENYFPHKTPGEAWDFDKIAQRIAEDKDISLDDAVRELNRMVRHGEARDAHLERSRVKLIDDKYRKDRDVLREYIVDARRRIATVQALGRVVTLKDGSHKVFPLAEGNALAQAIPDQLDRQFAETALKRFTGREELTRGHRISGKIRKAEALSKLGLGAVAQTLSLNETMAVAGVRNAARGLADAVAGVAREKVKAGTLKGPGVEGGRAYSPEELHALKSGALISHVVNELNETAGGGSKSEFLYGTGTMDRFMRVTADAAGKYLLRDLEKAGRWKEIESMGIAREMLKSNRAEAELLAGERVANASQLRTGAQHLPLWATSPWGRIVTQFSSFVYAHTTQFLAPLVKQAASGDARAAARLGRWAVMGAVVMGEGVNDIKALAKGYGVNLTGDSEQDEPTWRDVLKSKRIGGNHPLMRALQNFATASGFGIAQTIFDRALETKPSHSALGPAARDALDALDATRQNGLEGLAGKAVEMVPVFGNQLRGEFLGPRSTRSEDEGRRRIPAEPGWIGRMRDSVSPRTRVQRMEERQRLRDALARRREKAREQAVQGR